MYCTIPAGWSQDSNEWAMFSIWGAETPSNNGICHIRAEKIQAVNGSPGYFHCLANTNISIYEAEEDMTGGQVQAGHGVFLITTSGNTTTKVVNSTVHFIHNELDGTTGHIGAGYSWLVNHYYKNVECNHASWSVSYSEGTSNVASSIICDNVTVNNQWIVTGPTTDPLTTGEITFNNCDFTVDWYNSDRFSVLQWPGVITFNDCAFRISENRANDTYAQAVNVYFKITETNSNIIMNNPHFYSMTDGSGS